MDDINPAWPSIYIYIIYIYTYVGTPTADYVKSCRTACVSMAVPQILAFWHIGSCRSSVINSSILIRLGSGVPRKTQSPRHTTGNLLPHAGLVPSMTHWQVYSLRRCNRLGGFCKYLYIYTNIHAYTDTYTCVCIYVHVQIHIYIYIHTHVYTHTQPLGISYMFRFRVSNRL